MGPQVFKKEFVLGVGDSALNDFFRLKPIKPVLDFACGDGRNSLAMARKGIDVLALGLFAGWVGKTRTLFFVRAIEGKYSYAGF